MPETSPALAAGLLALLLAAPALQAAGGARVIEAGDGATPFGEWTGKRPTLHDLDGDDRPELLAMNKNGLVYVIDPLEGRVRAELRPETRKDGPPWSFNGPKAGDLDGDGTPEVVAATSSSVLTAWTRDPTEDRGHRLGFRKLWARDLHEHGWHTMDAPPALGDLDGDGKHEVVIMTEGRGLYALRHDGSTLWSLGEYGGNAEAVLRDVDRDGDLDALFFNDGGKVYALDGPTGELMWRFRGKEDHGAWPGSAASPGVVTDLDGDGSDEVVFCARNVESSSPDRLGAPLSEHHFVLFAVQEGELLWKRKPSWGNPLCSAYPMAHDVTGDGRREVLGLDWNTIGHKPGNWERTGPTNAFAFTADGEELWHTPLNARDSKPLAALADVTGDGDAELLAYEADGSGDALVALDARTGERESMVSLGGWQVEQGPLLADLDGSGRLSALVAVGQGSRHAFLVLDLPEGARALWPGWEPPTPASPYPARVEAEEAPEPPAPRAPSKTPPTVEGPPEPQGAAAPGPGWAWALAALAGATLRARSGRCRGRRGGSDSSPKP